MLDFYIRNCATENVLKAVTMDRTRTETSYQMQNQFLA